MTAEVTVVQKMIEGLVTSAKRDKTIAVSVERKRPHPRYGGKMVKNTTVYHVHDENNQAKEGDKVRIKESRPYSKTKSWVLVEVVGA